MQYKLNKKNYIMIKFKLKKEGINKIVILKLIFNMTLLIRKLLGCDDKTNHQPIHMQHMLGIWFPCYLSMALIVCNDQEVITYITSQWLIVNAYLARFPSRNILEILCIRVRYYLCLIRFKLSIRTI